jgi:hypothetical protein
MKVSQIQGKWAKNNLEQSFCFCFLKLMRKKKEKGRGSEAGKEL